MTRDLAHSIVRAKVPFTKLPDMIFLPEFFAEEHYARSVMYHYGWLLRYLRDFCTGIEHIKRVILASPCVTTPLDTRENLLLNVPKHLAGQLTSLTSLESIEIVQPDGAHWQTEVQQYRELGAWHGPLGLSKEIDKVYRM